MSKSKPKRRARANKNKLTWWKWERWKKSPIAWLIVFLFSIFLGIGINDFIVNPVSDLIHEDDIKIIVISTINVMGGESYFIEGVIQPLYAEDNTQYYRTDEDAGIYIFDVILPPFPFKEKDEIQFDYFGGYSESKNIRQTIYIYSKGSKIEDFNLKIYYGYPILEVEGIGSKSIHGNCVIIEITEDLPVTFDMLSEKNFPVTSVSLDTNNSINVSKIIYNFEARYYRKGIFYHYWKELSSDNLIHLGMLATDYYPPYEIFDSILRSGIEIPP